jgi:hypothetical protein
MSDLTTLVASAAPSRCAESRARHPISSADRPRWRPRSCSQVVLVVFAP